MRRTAHDAHGQGIRWRLAIGIEVVEQGQHVGQVARNRRAVLLALDLVDAQPPAVKHLGADGDARLGRARAVAEQAQPALLAGFGVVLAVAAAQRPRALNWPRQCRIIWLS